MVFCILLFLITSSFGICPLLMMEVVTSCLKRHPKSSLQQSSQLLRYFLREFVTSSPTQTRTGTWNISAGCMPYFLLLQMHSAGMPISNYHAACSAGAVYGTPTFLSRTMTGCVALCCLRATDGKVSDIFGVWEVVLPDKIVVTEE
ncbi:hypothetical protein LY78DRAFT_670488 [Colletotrichum sublineola]|nr:hypothetical protein LY78DRAFT_670488 [Colletotrichum sublineola]